MKLLRFSIISVVILLTGWSFSQPVLSVSSEQNFHQVKVSLEKALEHNGFAIDRFLDVGQTIRFRNDLQAEDFMPLGIYVLQANQTTLKAIEENPTLSALYPESIVVYEQDGESHIAWLDATALTANFKLSQLTELELMTQAVKLRQSLSTLGMRHAHTTVSTTSAPYILGNVEDDDLEGSMFFYSSIYQDQNMNLVGEIELGSTQQAWLCNARIAKEIFGLEPRIAVIAPCRIFAFKENDQVVLGMVNPDYVLEAFPTISSNQVALSSFEEMKQMGEQVFFEMGVE